MSQPDILRGLPEPEAFIKAWERALPLAVAALGRVVVYELSNALQAEFCGLPCVDWDSYRETAVELDITDIDCSELFEGALPILEAKLTERGYKAWIDNREAKLGGPVLVIRPPRKRAIPGAAEAPVAKRPRIE